MSIEEVYARVLDQVVSWETHLSDPRGTTAPSQALTTVGADQGLSLARKAEGQFATLRNSIETAIMRCKKANIVCNPLTSLKPAVVGPVAPRRQR